MADGIATLSSVTTSSIAIQRINDNRQNINKLGTQEVKEQKFATTAEMSAAQSFKLMDLKNQTATAEQNLAQASSFYDKISSAEQIVDSIIKKVTELNGTIVTNKTLTPQSKIVINTQISDALQFMQSQMNTSGPAGYIFASSSNKNTQPISDIINSANYSGPNNTPNASYVVNPAQPELITLSANMPSVNASIDPGDPAFVNIIAALHQIQDALNQNPLPNTLPQNVVDLFNTAQTGLADFLDTNLHPLLNLAETAKEANKDAIERVIDTLEAEFANDPIATNEIIADLVSQIEMLLSIHNLRNTTPPWKIR